MAELRIMQTMPYDSPGTLDLGEIPMGSPLTRAPRRGRVGLDRQFSTSISLS